MTFEQRLAAAGDDPVKLKALAKEYDSALKTTRHEAMSRRQNEETLSAELKKHKDAAKERERSEMTELQKAQDDLKTAQDELTKVRGELASTQARSDFLEAGASDIDSVSALWNQLPEDERAKLKPKEWAETLKTTKSHLFGGTSQPPAGFGGNPRGDEGGTGSGGSKTITHPESLNDINQVWSDFDQMFSN